MKRWWWLVGRARRERERELDEELRVHLDMETAANRARGLDEAEARAAAARTLGGVALVKEEVRDSWGVRFLDSLVGDIRIGLRGLAKSRGFTALVVMTLALGIGANTAIFSVVNGVMLAPLPYADGDRLVRLRQQAPAAGLVDLRFSPLEVADYRAQTQSFTGLAEYHSMWFHLLGKGEPLRVQTGVVSANFFEVLGVTPALGRSFLPGEDAHGAQPVLLLSHGFWQRAYGGDPGIIGQTVEMNDKPHVIVGVLPPIPLYPDDNDVYMPTSACPFRSSDQVESNRRARMSRLFGRLAPGATLPGAGAELATVVERMRAAHPGEYADLPSLRAGAVAVEAELTEAGRTRLLILLGVAGFVLLIVCANVANLTLARGLRRNHEMAVRAALGADRLRLFRQLTTEGLILALSGGAIGLLVTALCHGLLVSYAARFSPRAAEIRVDAAVALFALVSSVAAGLVFAALPALPRRRDLAADIRDEAARGGGASRGRLRALLVVAQVAFSFMLLIGAGLMARSLLRLEGVDPGFKGDRVLTARLDLDWSKFRDPAKSQDAVAKYQRVLERVSALPGVRSAAVATTFPLSQLDPFRGQYEIRGHRPATPEARRLADVRVASPGYFATIGVPLVAGRGFEARDGADAPKVVVVNQTLARRGFADGGEDALRGQISFDGGETWLAVVGVVGDVKQRGLDAEVKEEIYQPLAQLPTFSGSLLVRTAGDPVALARDVAAAVHAIDPDQPVSDVRTLDEVRAASLASPRLTAMLLGLLALLALAITAAGLGGVIALTVSQRTREIAVRMALGARRGQVLAEVLRQGLALAIAGLGIGALGALALGRALRSLLYEIRPTDLATYVGAGLVLLAVAVVACAVPARRAAGIDPMIALRSG
jgi:putative ABC transport system permease protein